MMQSESINELSAALAKAQGAIEGAVKGKENPHFRSKYADLGAVWDACREHLSKNGIAVVQLTDVVKAATGETGQLCTITRLLHASGQWIEDGGIPLLLSKQDMQGLGSALTYSRRYGLMAMVGIAPEDDDGNAASPRAGATRTVDVPAVPDPKGYAAWLAVLTSVADDGVDALKKAWTQSKPEYRTHLIKIDPDGWETLKAKAAQRDQVVSA